MKTYRLMLTVFMALIIASMGGCHAVPECVGYCEAGDGGEVDGPDAGDVQVDVGDGIEGAEIPDMGDVEGAEAADIITETADGPEGCIPCEYLFPNCVEGHTCCADPYGVETCNNMDDDCDSEIDEDINFNEDPRHCGECNNSCRLPHADVRCESGTCVFHGCLTYYQDCIPDDPADPDTMGCEYYCTPSAEDDTICDLLDNDCDCFIDEDIDLTTDIDNCGRCGLRCRFPHALAQCHSHDGTPENAICMIGDCLEGYWDDDGSPENGCEYECTPCEYTEGSCMAGHTCCTADGRELCNSFDDDCDGAVDNGNPEGGASCGSDVGECTAGIDRCIDGSIVCDGEVGPAREMCDGLDNDCDGTPDEPDSGEMYLPDEDWPCGESRGDCEFGVTRCVDGTIECQGGVDPVPEVCDGHDNDCDGTEDESPLPGEGDPCGSGVGTCVQGSQVCQAGGWICSGEVGPTTEICDGLDNDCNGTIDDPFNFNYDPQHCGGCGNRCADIMGPHAIYICDMGTCTVLGCDEGWWDIDADPYTCEYACTYSGDEICDGADNDCDGLTDLFDPSMATVPNFCNQTGPCAGSEPQCTVHGGVTQWYCNYGSDVNLDTDFLTILPEDDCDNIDNDCDSDIDEAFPLKGSSCFDGIGLCRREGQYVCNPSQDGIECNAVAGTPDPEACNGVDDNCDGIIDNFNEDDWTTIGAIAASTGRVQYIFQYEASRPNADSCDGGTQEGTGATILTTPCSKVSVQPWATVDWVTAQAACCNLNNDDICHYGGGGEPQRWNLCEAADWEDICESEGNDYAYPYGNNYQGNYCNGNDYDTDCPCPGPECPSTTGDQDEIMPTGSMTNCCSDWSGSCAYDMSGNIKEWTLTQRGAGYREIRGGANNVPISGLTCQFDFALGGEDFTFYNLGFRCCYYQP